MTLPAYVRADVIGSIAAQHLQPDDLHDLCAQVAELLGWTYRGGYPRVARVRELLGRQGARGRHGRSMRRHVALQILHGVGAAEQEYHDMLHAVICAELGAENTTNRR